MVWFEMDKDRANELLRTGIATLKGEMFEARSGILIAHAIMIKEKLLDAGFWWQADIIDLWIRRFYRAERLGSSLEMRRDSS